MARVYTEYKPFAVAFQDRFKRWAGRGLEIQSYRDSEIVLVTYPTKPETSHIGSAIRSQFLIAHPKLIQKKGGREETYMHVQDHRPENKRKIFLQLFPDGLVVCDNEARFREELETGRYNLNHLPKNIAMRQAIPGEDIITRVICTLNQMRETAPLAESVVFYKH